jgi:hypothetical protein
MRAKETIMPRFEVKQTVSFDTYMCSSDCDFLQKHIHPVGDEYYHCSKYNKALGYGEQRCNGCIVEFGERKEFVINITEITDRTVIVEADSLEDAKEWLKMRWEQYTDPFEDNGTEEHELELREEETGDLDLSIQDWERIYVPQNWGK